MCTGGGTIISIKTYYSAAHISSVFGGPRLLASEWHPNVDLVKGHISLHKLRKASREVHGRPFRKHLVPVFRTNLMSNERVRSDSGGLNI